MTFISPLDLLDVSPNEQDIIRCLIRQPKLTAKEIAHTTRIPFQELEKTLRRMVRDARLTQQSHEGEVAYQVTLGNDKGRQKSSAKNSLLDDLFG